jgi:hypothetical protein
LNKDDAYTIPVHPIVDCFIDGVKVRALVDTGSMRSFLSDKFIAIIDFNNNRTHKDNTRCVSITGDSLNITDSISLLVRFNK